MDFSEARLSELIKYDKLFTMEKNLIEIVRRGVCVCGCVLERSFDLAWTHRYKNKTKSYLIACC